MAAALAAVFVVRTVVLDGLGGYGDESVGPGRIVATAASYGVASFSPAQLELLRFPVLLLGPLALAAGFAICLRRLGGRRRRVALAGLAWLVLALVPVLGLPLDLNNANGERLLLLPSAGLALAFGALVPEAPLHGAGRWLAAGAAAAAALLCLDSARSWERAGEIAERVTAQAARLAPPGGRLLVVTFPDSYRSARVFTNSLDVAVRRAGRGDAELSWCVPVQVRHERVGAIRVDPAPAGRLEARTGWDAPFDFPVLRDPAPLVPGCAYSRADEDEGAPGLRLAAVASPEEPFVRARRAYFDGRDLRPLP
jgi:hypothetical protein